ncbi:apolipoprotein C-I [Eublepharis macularius]|uniref:Apolipoprotein C-I n=1 Tax=Eublepharis macularius TaxID=481883 RepID=A0AA97LGZ4_EUBMA|nr:apolipoprotein C-I [Eublepharis macularius]
MQLAVSIAVILMALSVVTESTEVSPTEPTLSQKFERFQNEFRTFVDNVKEKTQGAFHDLHNSEFSNKTRNWFSEKFRKLREKIHTTFGDTD